MASIWKSINKVKTVKYHTVTEQDERFGTRPERRRGKFNGKKMEKKKKGRMCRKHHSLSSESRNKHLE